MTPLTPMLAFLAPDRLWLLLIIPVLVLAYLFLVSRRRNRSKTVGQTMFDLVIPGTGRGCAISRWACRSSAC